MADGPILSEYNCRRNGASSPGTGVPVGATIMEEVNEMAGLLWTVITILFVLWLIGFAMHIGGGLIHLLLVVAVIMFLFNLFTGRRTVA